MSMTKEVNLCYKQIGATYHSESCLSLKFQHNLYTLWSLRQQSFDSTTITSLIYSRQGIYLLDNINDAWYDSNEATKGFSRLNADYKQIKTTIRLETKDLLICQNMKEFLKEKKIWSNKEFSLAKLFRI